MSQRMSVTAREIKAGDTIHHPHAGDMKVYKDAVFHEAGTAGDDPYVQIFYKETDGRETWAFFPDNDDQVDLTR